MSAEGNIRNRVMLSLACEALADAKKLIERAAWRLGDTTGSPNTRAEFDRVRFMAERVGRQLDWHRKKLIRAKDREEAEGPK
jgi:hypothetical protein